MSLVVKPESSKSTNSNESTAKGIKTETNQETITIYVQRTDLSVLPLSVRGDDTIDSIKGSLHVMTELAPDMQRLIFSGKQLEDGRTLDDYKVVDHSTLKLVLRLRGS